MKAALTFFVFSPLVFVLTACGTSAVRTEPLPGAGEIRVGSHEVANVSVGSLNFYGVSVLLYAEQTPQNYFSLTLDRRDVREGFTSPAPLARKNVIDAHWNGRFYDASSRYPTYAHLAIRSLSEEEAVLEVEARLVHPETGKFIHLPHALLNIRGDDLAVLTERL